jgi:hypothetical protein
MEWYGWNGMESKEVKVDEIVHREKGNDHIGNFLNQTIVCI